MSDIDISSFGTYDAKNNKAQNKSKKSSDAIDISSFGTYNDKSRPVKTTDTVQFDTKISKKEIEQKAKRTKKNIEKTKASHYYNPPITEKAKQVGGLIWDIVKGTSEFSEVHDLVNYIQGRADEMESYAKQGYEDKNLARIGRVLAQGAATVVSFADPVAIEKFAEQAIPHPITTGKEFAKSLVSKEQWKKDPIGTAVMVAGLGKGGIDIAKGAPSAIAGSAREIPKASLLFVKDSKLLGAVTHPIKVAQVVASPLTDFVRRNTFGRVDGLKFIDEFYSKPIKERQEIVQNWYTASMGTPIPKPMLDDIASPTAKELANAKWKIKESARKFFYGGDPFLNKEALKTFGLDDEQANIVSNSPNQYDAAMQITKYVIDKNIESLKDLSKQTKEKITEYYELKPIDEATRQDKAALEEEINGLIERDLTDRKYTDIDERAENIKQTISDWIDRKNEVQQQLNELKQTSDSQRVMDSTGEYFHRIYRTYRNMNSAKKSIVNYLKENHPNVENPEIIFEAMRDLYRNNISTDHIKTISETAFDESGGNRLIADITEYGDLPPSQVKLYSDLINKYNLYDEYQAIFQQFDRMQKNIDRKIDPSIWRQRGKEYNLTEKDLNSFFKTYKRQGARIIKEYGNEKYRVWRDLTPKEQKDLGRIMEFDVNAANTEFLLSNNLNALEFQKKIAEAMTQDGEHALAIDFEPPNMAEEPISGSLNPSEANTQLRSEWNKKIVEFKKRFDAYGIGTKVMPKGKQYGALAGKIVPDFIHKMFVKDLPQMGRGLADIYSWYEKNWYPWWKKTTTVYHYKTHIRNVLFNSILSEMGGNSIFNPTNWKYYEAAIKEFQKGKKSEVLEEFTKQGSDLGHTSFLSDADPKVVKSFNDFLENMSKDMSVGETPTTAFGRAMAKVGSGVEKGIVWFDDKASKAYRFEENFFKVAMALKKYAETGKWDTAVAHAQKYLFDYSDKTFSPFVKGLSKTPLLGSPFAKFSARFAPLFVEKLISDPMAILKYEIAFKGIQKFVQEKNDIDADEEKIANAVRYPQNKNVIGTQTVQLYNMKSGAARTLNVGLFSPLATFQANLKNFVPVVNDPLAMMLWSSISGKDSLSKREIAMEGAKSESWDKIKYALSKTLTAPPQVRSLLSPTSGETTESKLIKSIVNPNSVSKEWTGLKPNKLDLIQRSFINMAQTENPYVSISKAIGTATYEYSIVAKRIEGRMKTNYIKARSEKPRLGENPAKNVQLYTISGEPTKTNKKQMADWKSLREKYLNEIAENLLLFDTLNQSRILRGVEPLPEDQAIRWGRKVLRHETVYYKLGVEKRKEERIKNKLESRLKKQGKIEIDSPDLSAFGEYKK